MVASVRANRAFLARVVRFLAAEAGIRQFLDVGNRLARETQRHRTHDEVARFFDGLDLLDPGLVPVQQWRPGSPAEASARSAMWGGAARKP